MPHNLRRISSTPIVYHQRNILYSTIFYFLCLFLVAVYSWESGYRAACRLFSLDPLPTAIFAANDIMAIGVIKAAEKARILIPHKLSVMGYDDIEMSNLCTPALTTIHQPKYEVGTEAARILINSLQKKEEQEKKVTLEIHVVERESVTNSLK